LGVEGVLLVLEGVVAVELLSVPAPCVELASSAASTAKLELSKLRDKRPAAIDLRIKNSSIGVKLINDVEVR
jgi:hypothetical protein